MADDVVWSVTVGIGAITSDRRRQAGGSDDAHDRQDELHQLVKNLEPDLRRMGESFPMPQ